MVKLIKVSGNVNLRLHYCEYKYGYANVNLRLLYCQFMVMLTLIYGLYNFNLLLNHFVILRNFEKIIL